MRDQCGPTVGYESYLALALATGRVVWRLALVVFHLLVPRPKGSVALVVFHRLVGPCLKAAPDACVSDPPCTTRHVVRGRTATRSGFT